MTLDEAREHTGETVLYSSVPGEAEEGVIVTVGETYVHVRYGRDQNAKATRPELLTLMRGGSLAEHLRLNMADAGFPAEVNGAEYGRHIPSGQMTDVTGGQGRPARQQCGGCSQPLTHERGEWRSVYTRSMWCRAAPAATAAGEGRPAAPEKEN